MKIGVVTYTPSGDLFTPQDNANQIIENQNKNTSDIIDALTNTNISGDINEILQFPTYDINSSVTSPTSNLFEYLINRISELFLNNSPTSLTLTIPYILNQPYTISSDFFQVNGVLLLFLNAFFTIKFILPRLSELYQLIKAMQMGYTDTFINYFGYGISINELL